MTTTTETGFFADELTVTIDERGTGRPVLLLHGGGGPQTMAGLPARAIGAVRERHRISGTVLINAVGIDVEGIELADFFALSPEELAEHAFHNPALFTDPATLPPEQQQALKANAAALAAYAKDPYMHDPKLRRRLKLVSTPVLWGESDEIAPVAYGRAYAESFANARFQLVPEAGHLPQIEQPGQVLDHIQRFAAAI